VEWAPAARSRGEASGGSGSADGAEPNECAEDAEEAAVGGHGQRADKLLRALGFVPKTHSVSDDITQNTKLILYSAALQTKVTFFFFSNNVIKKTLSANEFQ
jgi:hypothetical protein